MIQTMFSNQPSSKHSSIFYNRLNTYIQKSVRTVPATRPTLFGPEIALSCLNEQHQDPTPIRWLYNTLHTFDHKTFQKAMTKTSEYLIKSYPLGIYCCYVLWQEFEISQVSECQEQSVKQTLLMYIHSHPLQTIRMASAWERDKITYFLHCSQICNIIIS